HGLELGRAAAGCPSAVPRGTGRVHGPALEPGPRRLAAAHGLPWLAGARRGGARRARLPQEAVPHPGPARRPRPAAGREPAPVPGQDEPGVRGHRAVCEPRALVDLLDHLGPQLDQLWQSADLGATGEAVSWAAPGQPAPVWLDIAREYSEFWVHQRQVRDAEGRPGANSDRPAWAAPDTFLCAL